jgi:hypothetical protein
MTEAERERLAKLIEAEADDISEKFSSAEPDQYWYYEKAIEDAARLIREQPAESPWISVEYRLPETEGKVLVHCPSADPDNPLITTAWFHPEEGGWTLIHAYWIPAIRHWMPLPPPPA